MSEVNQYVFTHKELAEMMIKKAGVDEGKWMVLINFVFAGMNCGPTLDKATPAALAAIQSIGISKAVPESPPNLIVDAAQVNPAAETKPKRKST